MSDLSGRFGLGLPVLFLFLASGCLHHGDDGPELAPVSGTVTLDGVPLAEAHVRFSPEKGRSSIGVTALDGSYILAYTKEKDGALRGRHVVSITTSKYLEDAQGNEIRTPELLPNRYHRNAIDNPEMHVFINENANTFDFELTSDLDPSDLVGNPYLTGGPMGDPLPVVAPVPAADRSFRSGPRVAQP